jgi:8-oxo-dGTP pyrophosphatase MutT (NUDIX family)
MSEKFPSKWQVIQDDIHADCRIFEVHKRKMLRESDQKEGEFYVIETNDWVNVLAMTQEQEIILVRQFRYGTEQYSLEPPGGVIERGEDPIVAGQRELLEETGYSGKNPKIIGKVFANSAIMSNRCHFLFLTDVEKSAEVSFDPHEELETVKVSIDKLKDLVQSGQISHSIGVNAVFHLMMELGIV